MRQKELQEEISKIIGLPLNEFDFYKQDKTKVNADFSLHVHYKHFEEWVDCYSKESVFMQLSFFILENYMTGRELKDIPYIHVYLKGQQHGIWLYKYDYLNRRMLTKDSNITLL